MKTPSFRYQGFSYSVIIKPWKRGDKKYEIIKKEIGNPANWSRITVEEYKKVKGLAGIENPYELTYYRSGWSQKRVDKNNKNYWDWEIKYKGFVPANADLEKLKEYKEKITL